MFRRSFIAGAAGLWLSGAARADPPLGLSQLRARGELCELRAADLAFTELRVRDVLQMEHPPLMGLPGRITGYGEAGSHPGPLSFYALAPTYWLLGSTAWSLKVGVVVLDVVALGLTLVMVHRRGGPTATLSLAAGLAVLLRAYGAHQLTEPWNPFLPALWWVVFLGLFPTAIAFTTYAYALRHMSAGSLSVTTYIVPVLTVAISWVVLAEAPPALAYVGGTLCLVGVAITRRR